MEILIVLLILVTLAAGAWRWGVDSSDGVDSPEWERRRQWRGFAGVSVRGKNQ